MLPALVAAARARRVAPPSTGGPAPATTPATPATPAQTIAFRRRWLNRSPHRQNASSLRVGAPMRTRSSPPRVRATETFSLEAPSRAPRKAFSHSSSASHRSSTGVRFHRRHRGQTTQRRPFSPS